MYNTAIIGSNGYLGRHMAYYLESHGFNNTNYDLQPGPLYGQNNYNSLNLLEISDLEKLKTDLDFIFLFAGLNGTHQGFDNYTSFISVNEISLLNLLNWMHEHNCKARVIFPSSRLVYKCKDVPIREEDEKLPKTIYAVNKLAAENLFWVYNNSFGINYTIFRISLPYGDKFEDDFFKGNMGLFINRAKEGKNIKVYGEGKFRRTFTHIEDVCLQIISSIQKKETMNETFNIGGEDYSLFEVAKIVAEHYSVKVEFTEWPELDKLIESGNTVFDSQKITAIQEYIYKHRITDLFKKEMEI